VFFIFFNILFICKNFPNLSTNKYLLVLIFFTIGFLSAHVLGVELLEGTDKDGGLQGSIEMNNVKLTGLENAVKHVGSAAVYTTGMSVGAGLLKSSGMPLGAKIASTIGIGAASLVGYNLVQKSMSLDKKSGNINLQAENVKSTLNNTGYSPNDKSFPNASALEDNENVNLEDITEVLNLNLILHYVILYLLVLVFILLIFR
jgi:hypothetical protein